MQVKQSQPAVSPDSQSVYKQSARQRMLRAQVCPGLR